MTAHPTITPSDPSGALVVLPSHLRTLVSSMISTGTDDASGSLRYSLREVQAPPIDGAVRAAAEVALQQLDEVLRPARRSWAAGRAATLLSHYYVPEMPEELQRAVLDDWVEALTEFSEAVINQASREYLETEPKRRPTIAAIVVICDRWAGRPSAERRAIGRLLGKHIALSARELRQQHAEQTRAEAARASDPIIAAVMELNRERARWQ